MCMALCCTDKELTLNFKYPVIVRFGTDVDLLNDFGEFRPTSCVARDWIVYCKNNVDNKEETC